MYKRQTVGLASEPSSLYGASVGKTENEEQIIGNAMLDSLVKFNYSTNEIEPSLATEWEWVCLLYTSGTLTVSFMGWLSILFLLSQSIS